MRKNNKFLSKQIARFGAMTIRQMETVCLGKCTRATIYRMLDDLLELKLIKRMPHTGRAEAIFSPRPNLIQEIYKDEIKTHTGINEINIHHAIDVTNTLLTLSRYTFVTGIATEYEINSNDMRKFCHSRIPDGIIQITKDGISVELAVEVERTQRSDTRIQEVVDRYKETFIKNMPCTGLIVVTGNQAIHESYKNKILELPDEFQKMCLVVTSEGLTTLNQKHFGEFKECPQQSLEKYAAFLQNQIKFS